MASRLINKPILTAALGIGVVFGLCIAGATSDSTTSTVPLAEIKLVSETSVPPSEVAAAARNGNRGGARSNRGGARHRIIKTREQWDASCEAGELVAVDIR
jgi:hypothetical protein